MNLLDIFLIGLALSMDACALTIANCTTYGDRLTKTKSFSMPVAFAVFQGVMPLIGYFVGSTFAGYLESFSGYLVSAVFFILAGKIFFDIVKDFRSKGKDEKKKPADFNFGVLIIQAIATSIDALIVGVTLSLQLTLSIYWAVLIIACVTFVLVLISLIFGKYLGKLLGKYANWAGALILTALAIKELVTALI